MTSSKTTRYRLMANPNTYSRITCSAYGCDMRSGTNKLSEIKMFIFPRDPLRRRRWELATRRANWKSNNKSRLCSKHFISGKPSKDPKNPDYIPSIFVFSKNGQNSKSSSSQSTKSKTRGNSMIAESSGNSVCHNSEGTCITSTCGIKGFCSKCFSSESVSSAFSQSLAPLNQTLTQLMGKLKDMEEEREQLRNELAICRGEIYQLHESHQHCMTQPHSTSMGSKPNSSASVPSTSSVGVNEMLQSMYADESADEYDEDLVPSLYLEQIYDQPTKPSKGKRPKRLSNKKHSDEEIGILDQSQSPKKRKRVKKSNLESKGTAESLKDGKTSDTGSPITIVYLKR